MPKTANTHIKCVLVGSGAEEKIELAVTYSKDEYPSQYIPMVFENYIADVQVGSKSYELALWDTAGIFTFKMLICFPFFDSKYQKIK